jgi:hypothetical protein
MGEGTRLRTTEAVSVVVSGVSAPLTETGGGTMVGMSASRVASDWPLDAVVGAESVVRGAAIEEPPATAGSAEMDAGVDADADKAAEADAEAEMDVGEEGDAEFAGDGCDGCDEAGEVLVMALMAVLACVFFS